MPPRKSTSSVTPAEADETSQLSPIQPTDKPITATEQQLKARAELGVSVEDYLLPRSLTVRLAKSVLPPNTTIQKDAVLAIQKAATVFVSYLSSHANDATLKRTLAPSDVFAALTDLEFDQFRGRLEQELEAYMEIKAGKRKAKKSDGNGAGDASGTGEGDSGIVAPHDGDEDVEMLDNPTKRVKRASEGGAAGGAGGGEGDETQEEDIEEEEEEDEHEDEEEEEEEESHRVEDDIDGVEDLDKAPRPMDPDAEETEDEDGPASQLRDDMGLG
ncbi:Histone-fold [Penicillium chermesinum]|uniref:DNA polymerase epsilon subunit D n=1 Tax=Penicillium chermesinum TaxID=63820 RepID=A0A9W9PHH4_9EURO|nr:Histone-fold [Penicillium chermesinum]KAJ5246824.1 Histone-fold [Penicillium chermesinum]